MSAAEDVFYLALAENVARGAQCTRRNVGAVLVDPSLDAVVGVGANLSRMPGKSCLRGDCPRGTKTLQEVPSFEQGNHDYSDCISDHAEVRACRHEHLYPRSTLYVTCEPCRDCWDFLGLTLITRVVWPGNERTC